MITHDRGSPVPAGELDRLIEVYQQLRGPGSVERCSGGGWAQFGLMAGGAPGRRDQTDAGWALSVGFAHAQDLIGAEPRTMDGQFALARYSAARDVVEVITDPFGMQALYCAERAGLTFVSTSALVLARHLRASPDWTGARLFLRTGNQCGPVTHWDGIQRVAPGTGLHVDGGAPTLARYWAPVVDETVRGMNLSRTIDHCVDAGLQRIGPALAPVPRLWADLTGGFDSRMIAAFVARGRRPVDTGTSAEEEDVEVRVARAVARAGGYRWRQEKLPADWWPDAAAVDEALAWSDGTLEVLQLADVLRRFKSRAESFDIVVTGGGGEHFNAQPWRQEFVGAGRSSRVNFDNLLRFNVLGAVDLSTLRQPIDADVDPYLRAVFADVIRPYVREPNTTQLDLIYAYKTVGHVGAYHSATQAVLQSEVPCYYRDVFSAGFSSHHRWRGNHRLQRGIIERLSPATAGVPTDRGVPARATTARDLPRYVPYYGQRIHRLVRKAAGRTGRPSAATSRTTERNRAAIRTLRERRVLDVPDMRTVELYDHGRLESLLHRAESSGAVDWRAVGRIVTLELAYRSAAGLRAA